MTVSGTFLESFDERGRRASGPSSGATAAAGLSEADRLAAYESGYKSGWDDCAAAELEEIRKVSAELARNLGDLGFTYHEARSQLLGEVEALLSALFATIVPRITGSAIALRIIDDLVDLAAEAADAPVEIIVTPSEADTVRSLMPAAPTLPVQLVEEPALAVGQAYLRFGSVERRYDMSDLSERLLAALSEDAAKPQQGDAVATG